jgi:hypothetical protein
MRGRRFVAPTPVVAAASAEEDGGGDDDDELSFGTSTVSASRCRSVLLLDDEVDEQAGEGSRGASCNVASNELGRWSC